ncbi:hypothetical protein LJR009_002883 [Bosea sp. LjRoot9]|uniref:hypothetical protein n=1 Tax=Bosea sp. LjRoot9 TaxID=3342341 RepID=UPI003ECE1F90
MDLGAIPEGAVLVTTRDGDQYYQHDGGGISFPIVSDEASDAAAAKWVALLDEMVAG